MPDLPEARIPLPACLPAGAGGGGGGGGPGIRPWAREDGAGWLPGELLTSLRSGGLAAGEPAPAALCLPEPLVQRYRGARAHVRRRHPPGGPRRRSELGIWRRHLSSHPLLFPVSYPSRGDRWRWRYRAGNRWGVVLGEEEERKDALGGFPGPSPPDDPLVNTREVNIMTGCSGLSPWVWVTAPLGSRKRRSREE